MYSQNFVYKSVTQSSLPPSSNPEHLKTFPHFSEISQSSCEILFEVWDQGQKIGKSDAFMGLAIVAVSELLATASQRHVVPLQGRPYEEDKVGRRESLLFRRGERYR